MLARLLSAAWLTAVCLAAQIPFSVQVLQRPDGKAVEGLTPADVRVQQGASALDVVAMRAQEKPLDLVVVVEQRRWEPLDVVVQDALGALAARLEGNDRVGLLVAGAVVETVVPPGSAPSALAAALSRSRFNPGLRLPRPVPNERGPVLYDAILTAADYSPQDGIRRRAVLVVASGRDDDSQAGVERVTEAALRAGMIVTLAELPEEVFQADGGVLGSRPDLAGPTLPGGPPGPAQTRIPAPYPTPRPAPRRDGRPLTPLVAATGGEATDDWKGGNGLSALADRLRNRYEIVLKSFDERLGDVNVELQGEAAKKNKKAVVLVTQPRP
jgi:hypothetical protein